MTINVYSYIILLCTSNRHNTLIGDKLSYLVIGASWPYWYIAGREAVVGLSILA